MLAIADTPTTHAQSPFFCERKALPKPQAVLFDLDDTLINSKALMIPVGRALIKEMDLNGEGTCPGFKTGAPHAEYFKCRFGENSPKVQEYFEKLVTQLKAHLPHVLKTDVLDTQDESHIYRLKGALQTLQQLLDHGVPVAIVTNSPQALIDVSLPQIFPELYKEGKPPTNFVAIGVEAKDQGKPALDTTKRALAALHIPVVNSRVDASVYFVGDSHAHDVKIAHEMGMTGVLLSDIGMREGDVKRPSFLPLMEQPITDKNAHLTRYLYAADHADLQTLFTRALNGQAQGLAAGR